MDEKPKRGGGRRAQVMRVTNWPLEEAKQARTVGRIQACTGTAISLGFISCKEMGCERKPRLCGKRGSPHLLLGGSSFSSSTFLPFSSPPPT